MGTVGNVNISPAERQMFQKWRVETRALWMLLDSQYQRMYLVDGATPLTKFVEEQSIKYNDVRSLLSDALDYDDTEDLREAIADALEGPFEPASLDDWEWGLKRLLEAKLGE